MNADEVTADATGSAAEWKRVEASYAGEPLPEHALQQFENGEIPCDEPPGIIECMYQAWRAAGGTPRPRLINTAALVASMNYLRPGHPVTAKAFEICHELTAWLEQRSSGSLIPIPFVEVSLNHLALTINDESLWDSEGCAESELTLDACLGTYRQLLEDLMSPFVDEEV